MENLSSAPPAATGPPSPTILDAKLAQLTETRLPHIDHASLELHRALHHFRPITENYSSELYHESFNWDNLELPEEVKGEWYCVAFRSRRKANSDDHCKSTPLLASFTYIIHICNFLHSFYLYGLMTPVFHPASLNPAPLKPTVNSLHP